MPASESMERLAEQAVRAYDFARPRLRLISSTENTVFAVDTAGGDRYVLRLHRPTADPVRVRSELLWLDALRRDTELVVPRPVRLRSGEWLGLVASDDLPEPRPFVAFRWIDGPLLNDRLDRTVFCRLGELTARMHHHARSFDGGPGFVRGRLDADSYRPEELPGGLTGSGLLSTADRDLTRSAWAVVHDRVAGLGTGAGTFGLVHADLHQYNCLDVAGRLAPIDFDDCGFAHFAKSISPYATSTNPYLK